MTVIPSSLQVAITKIMNIDEGSGSGKNGNMLNAYHLWFAARMPEGLLRSRPQRQA